MNIRDKIKQSIDIPQERIEIKEWDVTLIIRGMSALDVMNIADIGEDKAAFANALLSSSIHDEEGNRLYPTPQDASELGEKSFPIVQRLLTAARRVNGIDGAEVKKD